MKHRQVESPEKHRRTKSRDKLSHRNKQFVLTSHNTDEVGYCLHYRNPLSCTKFTQIPCAYRRMHTHIPGSCNMVISIAAAYTVAICPAERDAPGPTRSLCPPALRFVYPICFSLYTIQVCESTCVGSLFFGTQFGKEVRENHRTTVHRPFHWEERREGRSRPTRCRNILPRHTCTL